MTEEIRANFDDKGILELWDNRAKDCDIRAIAPLIRQSSPKLSLQINQKTGVISSSVKYL